MRIGHWDAFIAAFLALLLQFSMNPAVADKNWKFGSPSFPTGDASGTWTTASNWIEGLTPFSGDNVHILISTPNPDVVTYEGTFSSSATALNLRDLGTVGMFFDISAFSVPYLEVGSINVGMDGAATVRHHRGHVITFNLNLAGQSTGRAQYDLNFGSLSVGTSFNVGERGLGTFNQAGGEAYLHGGLRVGFLSSATGRMTLNNGTFYSVSGNEFIGFSGAGTFIQNGGAHTVDQADLNLGFNAGSSGYYRLNGGSLSVTGTERIGVAGVGTFVHVAGTRTASLILIGADPAGQGSYEISGLSGTALVVPELYVGRAGTGRFQHGDATVTVTNTLGIGALAGSAGTYSFSAGGTALRTLNAQNIRIGQSGTGTLLLSADANNIIAAHDVRIGVSAGGTFDQSGGSFTIDAGGLPGLVLGDGASGVGYYHAHAVGGIVPRMSLANAMYVGNAGVGTFILGLNAVGTISVPSEIALSVGNQFGSNGHVQMNGGGTLTVHGHIAVGNQGTGRFDQTSGTFRLTQPGVAVAIGNYPSGVGTYTLSGGTLDASLVRVYVADAGAATFLQTGGRHNANILYLASAPGSSGFYSLSGGTLSVSNAAYVGQFGNGTFVQSGGVGSISLPGDIALSLANQEGSTGFLQLGGTANLSVQGVVSVGNKGTGRVNHTAGRLTLTQPGMFLTLGNYATGVGTYNLSGGTLNASQQTAFVGDAGTGTFLQSGGVHNAGTLIIARLPGSTGRYVLSGGTLDANNTLVNNDGILTCTGGVISLGSLSVNGGTVRVTGGSGKVLRTTSVTINIAASGMIDLTENALLVDYTGASPISLIRDYLISSYSSGDEAWNGPGIGSSAAAAVPGSAVGYAEASLLGSIPPIFGSVDGSAVLARYTLYGDANLDATVNLSDFSLLAANFNLPSDWFRGDFNYDGTTGIGDFSLLSANFNTSLPANPFRPDSVIPEPFASVLLLVLVPGRRRTRFPRKNS